MSNRPFRIAIVGAGFSGTLLSVHLLRHSRHEDRVYLLDKRAGFGRGLAYSTDNRGHVLNVRARNMSAFPDRPDHFVEWLAARTRDRGRPSPSADTFVPRGLYGDYLQSVLRQELWQHGRARNLFLIPDEAVALVEDREGVSLTVGCGRAYRLDAAVLAVGNLPPTGSKGAYFGNPWDPAATVGVPPNASVLLIGTGLTMVDVVQSLLHAGHRGRIYAISRRGLLPHPHETTPRFTLSPFPHPSPSSLVRLVRWVRGEVDRAQAEGAGWRAVIDGLRTHTHEIWRRLPLEERRRFLRHLRPWWDIHRHRMAPSVDALLKATMSRGQLTVTAARISKLDVADDSAVAHLRRRGSMAVEPLRVARVINCSGPETDYAACSDPLLRDLLARGAARPDPLRLGLDVTEDGALIGLNGAVSERLYGVGPVTRGTFWEITAVPDIRLQCARMAKHLVTRLRSADSADGADRSAQLAHMRSYSVKPASEEADASPTAIAAGMSPAGNR